MKMGGWFKCPICGKKVRAIPFLKIHFIGAHRGNTIRKCPYCPLTFDSYDEFKRHVLYLARNGDEEHQALAYLVVRHTALYKRQYRLNAEKVFYEE